MSTYNTVKVLLLKWEDDDLGVDEEVNKLSDLFSAPYPEGYNFITDIWHIPSGLAEGTDPQDLLNERINQFKRHATATDLLILFYGGHGKGIPQNLIWYANNRQHSPWLNWHNLQGLLLGSPASVLFILDCCYADLGTSNGGVGDNWMLGATTRTDVAEGAGYFSFTSTLTRELERCARVFYDQGQQTSVQGLHSNLSRWGRDLKHTSILTRLADIEFGPIKVVPDTRPRLRASNTHPGAQPVARPSSHIFPRSNMRGPGPVDPQVKERVYGRLRSYDTKFLVDDSDSMYGENWEIVKEAVSVTASIAVEHDSDGIDVQFFTASIDKKERQNLKRVADVMSLFEKVEPYGDTPTADKLDEELNEYCLRYSQNRDMKGLNLIILTDGDPSPGQDVTGVLLEYARELARLKAPKLKVGVQFVQIGSDEKAREFLKGLDDDLKGPYKLDRDVRLCELLPAPYRC